MQQNSKSLNIVVPMAGAGKSFLQAGYTVPKPLVDVNGRPMIEKVIENLKPKKYPHKFVFIVKNDHYEKYPFAEIFQKTTDGNFDVINLQMIPQGAACTILSAIDKINNNNELLIANADQIVDVSIDEFISNARQEKASAAIMTFEASHPKWSFARISGKNEVIETAEKKVISSHATCGIYYYSKGSLFVDAVLLMIAKDIRFNNEFYVSPSFNEIILKNEKVISWEIERSKMHSMGTAEDLAKYLHFIEVSNRKSTVAVFKKSQRSKYKKIGKNT